MGGTGPFLDDTEAMTGLRGNLGEVCRALHYRLFWPRRPRAACYPGPRGHPIFPTRHEPFHRATVGRKLDLQEAASDTRTIQHGFAITLTLGIVHADEGPATPVAGVTGPELVDRCRSGSVPCSQASPRPHLARPPTADTALLAAGCFPGCTKRTRVLHAAATRARRSRREAAALATRALRHRHAVLRRVQLRVSGPNPLLRAATGPNA